MGEAFNRVLAAFEDEGDADICRPAWISEEDVTARPWHPAASVPESDPTSDEFAHDPESRMSELSAAGLDVDRAALAALYDETKAAAHEEGYLAGVEEGQVVGEEAGRAAMEAELATLTRVREQLEIELESMAGVRKDLLRDAEEQAVELALLVGKRIAMEAQLHDTSWVEPLVRNASLALTNGDRLICRVGIELADRLERSGGTFELEGAVFERSHDLGPLEVVVETECGHVDAGLEARFGELATAIRERTARVPNDDSAG